MSHVLQTPHLPGVSLSPALSNSRIQGLVRNTAFRMVGGSSLVLDAKTLGILYQPRLLNSHFPYEIQLLPPFLSKYDLLGASPIPRKCSKFLRVLLTSLSYGSPLSHVSMCVFEWLCQLSA